MHSDRDQFVQRLIQALTDWRTNADGTAWTFFGLILVVGLLLVLAVLVWVLRGGLAGYAGVQSRNSES